jgi:RNA polymerase sigma factor for flagellar operon FliA
MEKVSSTSLNSYWEEWFKKKDEASCNNLLGYYQYLVKYHVGRIAVGLPRNISQDELFSFGMSGLYDALLKFDSKRDLKFDTYASFRVRGAIIDGLRKEDWLSRSLREKIKKIDSTTEMLQQKLMRKITSSDIAEELGMSVEEVETIVAEGYFANTLSLEDMQNDSSDGYISYTLEDKQVLTPEESILDVELKSLLVKKLKDLNEKEQLVLSLFYYEELTLTEIGNVLDLTTSRISQIHSKALFKLRDIMMKASV